MHFQGRNSNTGAQVLEGQLEEFAVHPHRISTDLFASFYDLSWWEKMWFKMVWAYNYKANKLCSEHVYKHKAKL